MAERQLIPLTDIYIDEMVAIEEASFPTPWSKQAYLQELNSNPIAFYIACVEDSHLLGYAGIWLIADEGHISNVAAVSYTHLDVYKRQDLRPYVPKGFQTGNAGAE